MIYIYDILLNFNDGNRVYDFYEWKDEDDVLHIKKIPLFKISCDDMNNIINNSIKISKAFLDKIENKTVLYKHNKIIKYAVLFCDLSRVVAIEFSDSGISICKSSLLLDEEDDICQECSLFSDYKFDYGVFDSSTDDLFLTREEMFKRQYLVKEINYLYDNGVVDKFNYLYEEIFGKGESSIDDKYKLIISDINSNYDDRYNYLYDIVRLSYQKK